jgi:hypothetical protein
MPSPEELTVLQRECTIWVDKTDASGTRYFGRELDIPETAATVRVREGETLVTDGPFAETKEFMAGFDVLECADLDDAIEVAAAHPCSWFQAIEIRPFVDEVQLGDKAMAFGRSEDDGATPYLLMTWADPASTAPSDESAVTPATEAWRQKVQTSGQHVLALPVGGPDVATTVRVRDGETQLTDGPSIPTAEAIIGLEVVSCSDRQRAIELAAAHPMARYHAIEVRPFYQE